MNLLRVLVCVLMVLPQEKPARELAKVTFGKKETVNLTVLKPKDYDKKKKYPVVFTLPPGDGSAAMVDATLNLYWQAEAFERGYIVVCPEILGPSLDTKAKTLVPAIFAWMDKNLGYDKARVTLTGVSAGGIGMFHVAVAFPERFNGLIGLPAVRGEEKPANLKPLKDKPVWLLCGSKDHGKAQDTTLKALTDAGAKATLEVLEGQGHELQIEQKKLFDWMDTLKPEEKK